jgi:hypothetical protein
MRLRVFRVTSLLHKCRGVQLRSKTPWPLPDSLTFRPLCLRRKVTTAHTGRQLTVSHFTCGPRYYSHALSAKPAPTAAYLLIGNRFDFRVYNLNRKMFMLKSALTTQILVLTTRTASFNIMKTTFCPHSIFVCFVWTSEQTAIISLYSINWLVFITGCVYWAVRTESLYLYT